MNSIKLNHGKYALVDDVDFEIQGVFEWSARQTPCGHWYAYRWDSKHRRMIHLHREIMSAPEHTDVDHIRSEATLDNRQSNLRLASRSQNLQNRRIKNQSGYKGLRKTRQGLWRARLRLPNGTDIECGSSHDPKIAAHFYDAAAQKYFGEFACLNFPEGA